jgi:hypothetical protein
MQGLFCSVWNGIMDKPSDAAILERAFRLTNDAMHAVALQRRRLRSAEPEDKHFFRHWTDLQFLIVALRRLRRAAQLASNVPLSKTELADALRRFDEALPMVSTMRNVGEHIDDYALDNEKRHHRQIHRRLLEVGAWDGTTYEWLGMELDIDQAHDAAFALFQSVRKALKSFPKLL